jgi:hypothetical protein
MLQLSFIVENIETKIPNTRTDKPTTNITEPLNISEKTLGLSCPLPLMNGK